MMPNELRIQRKALEAKKREILDALDRRDEIRIERSSDALDEIQYAADRDLAVTKLNHESRLLRKVEAALGRMANESYGICLHCENGITPRRLAAVPWAALCIRCQEQAEASQQEEILEPGKGVEAKLYAARRAA